MATVASGMCVLMLADRASASTDVEAYGVTATLPLLSFGPTPYANLSDPSDSVATIGTGGGANQFNANTLNASVQQDTAIGTESATASLEDLNATLAGIGITADALTATCNATAGSPTTGSVSLTGANVGGIAVAANPAVNTVIQVPPLLPILSVTLNEQIASGDQLTVNAIHVRLLAGVGDVIIGHAMCGPATLDPPPPVPLASGAGLYLGLGLAGATAAGVNARRRRRSTAVS
ncbi:hypothetical protein Aph01nite_15730 [Acrocarpospora phusangensis]|uniref:Uncharacterized protein n=1 Tax=Acrocarpospora phusangensis TaxID=1070424 RepID=A0A919Q9D5_9ACTN|nr:choice-of-anchor P family protein [Acrocarpospora phusangensis]GIH23263.1 hypothetical protein Aph01nite_15730 [Acrocarpospora phusangensis]